MNKRLIFLVTMSAILSTGCFKAKNDTVPLPVPQGNFSGQFSYIHKRPGSVVKYDTSKAQLVLTLANNRFKITGDTATLHAGSRGLFGMDAYYMQFADSTVYQSPTKFHLHGVYQYLYDGTALQIGASSGDSLSVFYDLRKN
jgi:hypothetical protein